MAKKMKNGREPDFHRLEPYVFLWSVPPQTTRRQGARAPFKATTFPPRGLAAGKSARRGSPGHTILVALRGPSKSAI